MKKAAILYAETVAVCCPYCSAEQPNKDDASELWLPEQLKRANVSGDLKCVACDKTMKFPLPRKIKLP